MQRRHFVGALAPLATAQTLADESSRALGSSRRAYGERSPHEMAERYFRRASPFPATGVSLTPLQQTLGMLTPSALHFERHHSGVPAIHPDKHRLVIHGMLSRPLSISMEELRRFPSVSRQHFIECGGNSQMEHAGSPGQNAQWSHGLVSCSEWTGVPLRVILNEVQPQGQASWLVAQGGDSARHSRSLPIDKAMDDVLVAYGQNGEAIRPEQGYPIRLVVPGWEGNVSVKWLESLELTDRPAMSRDEAVSYTDLLPNGMAQQFSFEMEVKSVILRPSGGQRIEHQGYYGISGIAWSGRGTITRVEVSVDGGLSWGSATLERPIHSKAFTRFTFPWRWNGSDTWVLSRATDSTGAVQPSREQLIRRRGMVAGPDGFNHYNGIKSWHVLSSGEVVHV